MSQAYLQGGGTAVNGYLVGAIAFFDANFSGSLDPAEPFTTTTGAGTFSLEVPTSFDSNQNGLLDDAEGQWVVFGGTDSSSGLPAASKLVAPGSWSVVTPLTTLVSTLAANHSMSTAVAMDSVIQGLGLPAVDLSTLNPIAAAMGGNAAAAEVFAAHARVQDTISQALAVLKGLDAMLVSDEIISLLVNEIADRIAASTTSVDLGDAEVVQMILGQVGLSSGIAIGEELLAGAASIIATTNQLIDDVPVTGDVAFLNQIAQVKIVAQDVVAAQLQAAAEGSLEIATVVQNNTFSSLQAQAAAAESVPARSFPRPFLRRRQEPPELWSATTQSVPTSQACRCRFRIRSNLANCFQ